MQTGSLMSLLAQVDLMCLQLKELYLLSAVVFVTVYARLPQTFHCPTV